MFWTPYADWIEVILSTTGMLLIAWLVLRPGAGGKD
ncbi:MAG: adenylosuccinate lyase [Synechococcaceae cyanobacterium]|nr:adenylosuccinate lyase [Synechococcaceae cyanobacterium]